MVTASDPDVPPAFGSLLRARRRGAGLTIEALAARSEVSPRAISDMERGRIHRPQRRTLQSLLDALASSGPDRQLLLAAAKAGRRSAPADSRPWCPLPSPAHSPTE